MDDRLQFALILEYNKGFLPGGIRFFMNILRKMRKLPKQDRVPNHVEIFDAENMEVIGSIGDGFKRRKFVDEMPRSHWKNLRFFVSKEPLTLKQMADISIRIHILEGRKYEKFNFLSWPVYILTFGKVRLSIDTDKRMECYESGARAYGRCYFPDPEYADIWQYIYNPMLKEYNGWEEEIEKSLNQQTL